jgi:hypothetical protein
LQHARYFPACQGVYWDQVVHGTDLQRSLIGDKSDSVTKLGAVCIFSG